MKKDIKKRYEKPTMKVFPLKSRQSLLVGSPDLPTGNNWPGGVPY